MTVGRGGRPRVCLDLFAGTGGATAAFVDRGWRVLRLDCDRRHRPDILGDVRRLPLAGRVDFLWASPPCTEFSDANPQVDHRRKRPQLGLIECTLEAVRDLRPRFWIMENVRGAIPFLGIPVQKIGPWCLWGYFPPLRVRWAMQTYEKARAGWTAEARAAIPYDVSLAVVEAVELLWDHPSILDLRAFRRHRHVAAVARRDGPELWG